MPITTKVDNTSRGLNTIGTLLKTAVDRNTARINSLQQAQGAQWNTPTLTPLNDNMQRIDERLARFELEVTSMKATKGAAIRFGSLGFKSFDESCSWLETIAPGGSFGFVVDFHIVMEHIHQQISGHDSLKNLERIYKLKLHTISEAVSMTSFEIITPRFLSSSGSHTVIQVKHRIFLTLHNFTCIAIPTRIFFDVLNQ